MSFQLHRWRKLTFRHTAERSHLATNPAKEWVAWPAHLSSLLNRAWNFIFMKSREKIHFQCHVPSQKSSSPFLLTNVNPFFSVSVSIPWISEWSPTALIRFALAHTARVEDERKCETSDSDNKFFRLSTWRFPPFTLRYTPSGQKCERAKKLFEKKSPPSMWRVREWRGGSGERRPNRKITLLFAQSILQDIIKFFPLSSVSFLVSEYIKACLQREITSSSFFIVRPTLFALTDSVEAANIHSSKKGQNYKHD